MYEELVKMLRVCGDSNNSCENCPILEDGCCQHGEWEFAAEKYMLEAADAIEELSKLNAEITDRELKLRMSKPRWIPVTEALPGEMDRSRGEWSEEIRPSDDVLVWLSSERRQSVAWYSYTYNEWTTVDENTVYCFEEVTHWMPLSEPPREES